MPELLINDQVSLKEAKKNDDGTWDVCCITPGWGSSGYYSEDLLKTDGVTVIKEGLHMYWDHATTIEEYSRPERSLRDLAGVLAENAKYDEDGWNGPGIYSNAKVFGAYEEMLNDPDFVEAIGLSLVCYGTSHIGEAEGESGEIIDQITAARSVDFVTLPGRGGKVKQRFESLRSEPVPSPSPEPKNKEADVVDEKEARQLREDNRTLEDEKHKLSESEKTLKAENGELKSENLDLKKQVAGHEAEKMAKEALSEFKKMPKAVAKRITESIVKNVPVDEDGELDKKALGKLVESTIESEAAYLTDLGFGKVKGLGGGNRLEENEDPEDDEDAEEDDEDDDDDEEQQESRRTPKTRKRLESAMGRLLDGDEKKTKIAVGR